MQTPDPENNASTPEESFDQILKDYERERSRKPEDGPRQIEGTVIAVTDEALVLDIGFKTEGSLPLSDLKPNESFKPGDKIPVAVKGRDPEGYYRLSRFKVAIPKDWSALERAFNDKTPIVGTVTAVVKGGLSVDVGVRAFMPASRTGTPDAAEMEKLVGQEIRCRITKLDVADENVVVDRRTMLEEEERAVAQRRFDEIKEGETVRGTVRSLADYGAFVDLGGVDGLLHVGEIAWSRVAKPSEVLSVGDQVTVRVIKVDSASRRISLSLRQLEENPWETITERYKVGERVRGTVSRVADFGAFVELMPGVEGLVHVSEMAWGRKVRIASDYLNVGDSVEAVVLSVDPEKRRIGLGLKQALGDPFEEASRQYAAGSVVEGAVTRLAAFGAFVQIADGVEGLVHISEITADRRLNHPSEELKVGQTVRAQVLAVDPEKRQFKLSIKQLAPTDIDEYLAEHKIGDSVTGRVIDVSGTQARVELGEGIVATAHVASAASAAAETKSAGGTDLSSLGAMLSAKWKGTAPAASGSKGEPVRAGQIRSFRITKLDAATKSVELELA